MKATDPAVIVEQTYPVSRERLWKAITTTAEMQDWFFPQLENFEPVAGFETGFTIEHEGKEYPHVWKITEAVPQEKIVYDWSYEGIPGRGIVTWELSSTDEGSHLKLTNIVTEDFPDDDPAFQRQSCESGWNYLLCDSLKSFLNE